MCRAQNGGPPNDRAAEIADMLAIPPLGLEADPSASSRIGECFSTNFPSRPCQRSAASNAFYFVVIASREPPTRTTLYLAAN